MRLCEVVLDQDPLRAVSESWSLGLSRGRFVLGARYIRQFHWSADLGANGRLREIVKPGGNCDSLSLTLCARIRPLAQPRLIQ